MRIKKKSATFYQLWRGEGSESEGIHDMLVNGSQTKEKNDNKKKKSEDRLTTTRAQNPIDEILSKLRKSKSNHSIERTIPLQEETIQLSKLT